MSIVILKWNPSFSSYTMARFLHNLEDCALENNGKFGMNWSIWDVDRVKTGDKFFLLKVGYGQTGIAASGAITSDPYPGEDWSLRDRATKYCDLDFETMINPDAFPLLTSAEMSEAIPDFDWYGGHSGVVLTDKQGEVLDRLWREYMQKQATYFENAADSNLFLHTTDAIPDNLPYTFELDNGYNGKVLKIQAQSHEITIRISIYNYPRFLGKFGVKSFRALRKMLISKYPSVSDLQHLCSDIFSAQIDFNVNFDNESD